MEQLLERTLQTSVDTQEAQQHNAQINERYRKLLSAENDQFSEQNNVAPTVSNVVAPTVSETPVMEQSPQVTEFVHERVSAPVFTADKFDLIREQAVKVAPIVAPVFERKEAIAVEAQYSLTPLAKVVMAVFTMIVIAMLTMICLNTKWIENKSTRIKNLEKQREELMERNEEIQQRIEIAQSEETIRQYAESHGMVQVG
ncbi:MAG: hypothetical protein IJD77_05805 [Clostridia bacterium]|nr:hypothetical protein [Clostridia bacterium]